MDAARPTPVQLAKGALRRLATAKLEPTPANYARAYAEEAGEMPPLEGAMPPRAHAQVDRLAMRATDDATLRGELSAALIAGRYDDLQRALDRGASSAATAAQAWATLIDRLARGLERGGRHWTGARKKDSLQRVLDGSRSDAQRLQHRLSQLISAWETDQPDADVDAIDGIQERPQADNRCRPPPKGDESSGQATLTQERPQADNRCRPPPEGDESSGQATLTHELDPVGAAAAPGAEPLVMPASLADGVIAQAYPRVVDALQVTVRAGLPADEPRAAELADELAALAARVVQDGATPLLADAVAEVCQRVQRLFGLRHELVDELLLLCRSLTEGLTDLAEEGSWARGQSESLRQRLDAPSGARAVRAARDLLDDTRAQQRALQSERVMARDALKLMVRQVLSELGELGNVTGRFNDKVAGYAQVIESADSLDGLTGMVRDMVTESRAVHDLVAAARERLATEHARASALEAKVLALESDLRRLSDEVSTDALTQVANRRGLAQAFEQECRRVERDGPTSAPLAIGLIDIDNFKKLNDSLGHAAGDVALQNLAARVKEWLRPVDHIARFGGEEFVVLMPSTPVDQAQQALTRLQRKLSASLFMHEGGEVFVTFSAGVTAWRPGEVVDVALARADEGLYEAKRTGKNRTCVA